MVTPTDDQKTVHLGDMLNFVIAKGGNPVALKEGRSLFQTARELYGDNTAHNLLDQLIFYNQRDDIKGKSN